jgi:hypothetical protein
MGMEPTLDGNWYPLLNETKFIVSLKSIVKVKEIKISSRGENKICLIAKYEASNFLWENT